MEITRFRMLNVSEVSGGRRSSQNYETETERIA
jgi:hypothetical protein